MEGCDVSEREYGNWSLQAEHCWIILLSLSLSLATPHPQRCCSDQTQPEKNKHYTIHILIHCHAAERAAAAAAPSLALVHTHTRTPTLLISLQKPTLALQVREDPGVDTAGMWVRSFIWKHLPGGLLPQPLLADNSSSAAGEWHVDISSHSWFCMSQWPSSVCHGISGVSARIFCQCGVTHESTLDLLSAAPGWEDNEANLIAFLELDLDCWKDASWASWEDSLQIGKTGKRERVFTSALHSRNTLHTSVVY